ncbi:cation diffusion facilitator family transporter [Pseudonocardia sp.]|uniref:cation diffusion facilitator family transporter n=1 Tax=Pseudonocardia sp. TaxID=60912 RepID=UPI003D136CFE
MSSSHDVGHDTATPSGPAAHGHGHGHGHGVSANADRRWLTIALVLISVFMVAEFVVGLIAGSLALLSDSAHMLTDAAAIVLALIAIRLAARPAKGGYTYGLRRAEILSAQANGITLLLLAVWFVYEGVARLIDPPPVEGGLVLVTALVGIVVNVAATWCISRANRSSLNVEGAFQHILNDLFAFIATAIAGVVLVTTGFTRADAIAALVVAALMIKAGWALVRESGRIFLEAAPRGTDPDALGAELVAVPGVAEVHDLHLWEITSGEAALSAHVMVRPQDDCHEVQKAVEEILRARHGLRHTTLQVDHAEPGVDDHCEESHGTAHRAVGPDGPVAPGAPRACR